MNQLVIGAAGPFLLGLSIYFIKHRRASLAMLILWPIAAMAGMVWAVIPDIPRLFGFNSLYFKMARDPRCDIFFWHYTIDQRETAVDIYAPFLVAMFAVMLIAAWHELYTREKH